MAVFGSARSGINSAADLEAAGWDYSVGHFNHENYATSEDYLAFFTSGESVGYIEHTIPGSGGVVMVRYGTDCCGSTGVFIGGVEVDVLDDTTTQDHVWVGPYAEGDTVRIADHDTNVDIVWEVLYREGMLFLHTVVCLCINTYFEDACAAFV